MIALFRDEHVCEQAWPRQSTHEGPAKGRCRRDPHAAAADVLWLDVPDHFESARHVFKLLRDFFADHMQRTLAVGANGRARGYGGATHAGSDRRPPANGTALA